MKKCNPQGHCFEVIPKLTARVFIKFNRLALRARISFLKHYIGWSVTSIFAQSKYSRPDLSCFKPFLPVQRYPFLPGLALNHHKKSLSPSKNKNFSRQSCLVFLPSTRDLLILRRGYYPHVKKRHLGGKMWRTSTPRHSTHVLVLAGSFTILRSGEGVTSFDKNNCVNFSGEKKENEGFRGNLFF